MALKRARQSGIIVAAAELDAAGATERGTDEIGEERGSRGEGTPV
jgi:hypothetical protein